MMWATLNEVSVSIVILQLQSMTIYIHLRLLQRLLYNCVLSFRMDLTLGRARTSALDSFPRRSLARHLPKLKGHLREKRLLNLEGIPRIPLAI